MSQETCGSGSRAHASSQCALTQSVASCSPAASIWMFLCTFSVISTVNLATGYTSVVRMTVAV